MSEERRRFVFSDEDGQINDYVVLCEFDDVPTKRHFVLSYDEHEEEEVLAGRKENISVVTKIILDNKSVIDVETDKDWDLVRDYLDKYFKEANGGCDCGHECGESCDCGEDKECGCEDHDHSKHHHHHHH
jgi:uncharacterized protein YrzB (UPF0473 family)